MYGPVVYFRLKKTKFYEVFDLEGLCSSIFYVFCFCWPLLLNKTRASSKLRFGKHSCVSIFVLAWSTLFINIYLLPFQLAYLNTVYYIISISICNIFVFLPLSWEVTLVAMSICWRILWPHPFGARRLNWEARDKPAENEGYSVHGIHPVCLTRVEYA